eukprot:1932957-Alexandrium_andersonii.AAC.1
MGVASGLADVRIGEAGRPGPAFESFAEARQQAAEERSSGFILRSVNATSLRAHFASMFEDTQQESDSPIDLHLIQEHSVPQEAL